ncbi:hypothetical protein GCK32_002790 [Trichostrongylus colubriformis]|uniref:Uncharacterized protein n=1 Tax=Trichostrongylus colubriformis TaxID=6319 RepID=A0AAN8EXH5_TRICO
MGLWLVIQLLLGTVLYICTMIDCGCGEKEADRLQKKAAARQQAQQQQQLMQQQLKTSSQERSREGAKPEASGSREGKRLAGQQPLPQHPLPAPIPGKSKEKEMAADDGGYEACPDLSPEELRRIAAQR